MENNPKVSIIIPFYNCSYVDQAIRSALNQTYKNIEIILVDDGSTNSTEKIVPFKDRIRYLRKENGGTATALNLGVQSATGEYIAWLSSDDFFLPEKISKQMSFMVDQNIDISFTNFDYIDKDNQVLVPWHGKRFSNVEGVYNAFLHFNAINGCTVVIKKELFERVGYFDPNFRYTHDYEMWFRLLINGYEIHYIDEVLIKFRTHEESGTKKYQPEMQKEMAIIEQHYRPLLTEYIKKFS
ncbi:glycosyltransferase [Priestia megaterium]|uniref:glycosyltransferase n=1 Tax=Priestia megaterium TaxID=1404 RepID=UPI002DBE7B43|nr:glycosyltransferase [Priestia megaterium]MEC1072094.1 glycosyltransferase [Priestia megaterium]